MTKPAKNTICLWYDGGAEGAAGFYARTFGDSSDGALHPAPGAVPAGERSRATGAASMPAPPSRASTKARAGA